MQVIEKKYISTAIVLAMLFSAVLSTIIVLMDVERPEVYKLLWVLPVTFTFLFAITFYLKQYIFTRMSVTIIIGTYWLRMVITPAVMVFGDYSLAIYNTGRTVNTSFFTYMDEAIILQCYECMVIFIVLALSSRYLKIKNEGRMEDIQKRYSHIFWSVIAGILLYLVIILLSEPRLIRVHFLPVWGAPEGWKLYDSIGRSLSGSGEGPLGIFVTLIGRVFILLQIILPPVLISKILINQQKRNTWLTMILLMCVCLLFFIAGTEDRGNSIICVFSALIASIAYFHQKVRSKIPFVLSIICLCAVLFLFNKSSNSLITISFYEQLSGMLTSYFSGSQNVAAAIQVRNENSLAISSLPIDIISAIPYGRPFLANSEFTESVFLHNNALYGYEGWADQLLPAIGMGYMYFGFIFAPIVPVSMVYFAVRFEVKALKSRDLLLKSIWYTGVFFLSYCAMNLNWHHATYFICYVLISLLIVHTAYFKRFKYHMRSAELLYR